MTESCWLRPWIEANLRANASQPARLGHPFPTIAFVLLALALVGCHSRPEPTPAMSRVERVKIAVDADGVYQVTADELRAVGFDLVHASQVGLRLSTGGEPVAFSLARDEETNELMVRFYGQSPKPTDYSATRIYWLAQNAVAGADNGRLSTLPARPPADLTPSTIATATVHLEIQQHYMPIVGMEDDPWLWQMISAPDQIELSLPTPHLAPGSGTLQIRVWARTAASQDPDHHLRLYLNGRLVADEWWDGMGSHLVEIFLPAGILRADANQLIIQAPGDTGAAADVIWVDWVELAHPRSLVADQEMLSFEGNAKSYRVQLRGELAALWDITDARQPLELTGYIEQHNSVTFAGYDSFRRYVVVTREGVRKPVAVIPARGPDLRTWPGGADMIIITAQPFMDALKPLVAARQARGLRVAMVDVEAVYDTFSYGQPGPEAIRAFFQHARAHWTPPAPRYLLLAGDASYDPRGYLSASEGTSADAEADWVPTMLVPTTYSGQTASDVWFILPDTSSSDEKGIGEVAVGRFPAQTADQMANMVAKTLAYEASLAQALPDEDPWRRRALLIADDGPDFLSAAQTGAAALGGYAVEVISLAEDNAKARAALLRSLEEGVGLVGYFGHGSLNMWAEEKVFSSEDAVKLRNRNRLPIVFTLTCLSGLFHHPVTASLAESLLRAEGGAVAVLAPSSAGLLEDQLWLAEGLARALAWPPAFSDSHESPSLTLGEVILQAWQSSTPITGDQAGLPSAQLQTLLTFNLLGDPTLLVRY